MSVSCRAPFRPEPCSHRDRGAVIVLVALMMTVLFVIAALVIDLGLVRQNRQSDKSAADFAAAAGVRGLDNASGVPQPWKGICAARAYLVANSDELASMTGNYANGDGTKTYATDPCASPTEAPFTDACGPGDQATWGTYTGSADGGRIRVTIRSGYELPDVARFPEDVVVYTGDDGSGVFDGCDHLAVIIEEGEDAYFGGVAGRSGYDTIIRSVARLVEGKTGDVSPALLLLERNDCNVLFIGGSSGAVVRAAGFANSPGVIHSDSLGNGTDCDAGDVENGNIFQVNSNPDDPRIIAERAAGPVGSEAPGQLSAVALSDAPWAEPLVAASPQHDEVCVQVDADDCLPPPPDVTGGALVGRDVIGRSRIDVRYRLPVRALHAEADLRFTWDSADAANAMFFEIDCDDPIPADKTHIWVNCGENQPFDGAGKTFGSLVEEVVINGYVTIGGKDNTLQFTDVDKLYIRGRTDGDQAAVKLEGSEGNRFVVNAGADPAAACASAGAAGATTKMVIGNGHVRVAGGNNDLNPKVLRLCQTTVLMGDNQGATPCPIPDDDGLAPYDNSCVGRILVAGEAAVDWTAPNVFPTTLPDDYQDLEDLAFWTETQGSGVEWGILGNGNVRLSGVFFIPNADPFHIGGNGAYDIEDAQIISRRLEVRGNAALRMRPDPVNSITIPVLGGYTLVR